MSVTFADRPEVVVDGRPPADRATGPAAPRPLGRAVAVAALTAVVGYFCFLLLKPFLPAVAWAVALATVSLPLHRFVRRLVPYDNWAAGLSVALVLTGIVLPLAFTAGQLAAEARSVGDRVRAEAADGPWREKLSRVPYVGDWAARAAPYVSVEEEARNFVGVLGQGTLGVVQGGAWAALQAVMAVFVLFFALRDRHLLLAAVADLIPLARADTDRALKRVDDAIHATVYGTLVTGVLQGATGGLMFGLLGLPAPVLWGVVMTVLSVLPVLGAFLVWVPAALFLAANGRAGAAAALAAWGVVMAGPVCNAVYAYAAAGRMRMHPVPALLAFVGGLAAFGVTGMVIGPAVLAFATALVDAWRQHILTGRAESAQPAGVGGV